MPGNTSQFNLVEEIRGFSRRWRRQAHHHQPAAIHVMHVRTDAGLEGICTVGDARYTTMQLSDLEQLRILAVGEDPFDRERLFDKLKTATRSMFTRPGWFGAFDNCLWDIAGKAAGLPVYALIGRARPSCPAYYNIGGAQGEAARERAVTDTQSAMAAGFVAVKDHFQDTVAGNIKLFEAVREAAGPDIEIMHDAAVAGYSFEEALKIGRALEALDFLWFEEPLPDEEQDSLRRLCQALDIPVVAPETMMHSLTLSAQWLIRGATDYLRANARHGTTAILKLAHLAELHDARIELNGPGGLFGLVHAHLVCAIRNTSYYEYFPGGSRDEIGREIGLLNPPLPEKGQISPPSTPGWGAEWDQAYFERQRVEWW
jgi:L-alanine-DL-glutamate epimerase-like enolase superfamily enzyme